MSNDGKKITFSFIKVKKPTLAKKNAETEEKVDYVDCFDGSKGKFSYKGNVRISKNFKEELVIPMPSSKTSSDILKSRIEASKNEDKKAAQDLSKENTIESKTNPQSSRNLDDLAALEILNEINNDHSKDKEKSKLIIETNDNTSGVSENDIDYDNIPVSEFGLALLRGMGWKPNQGIGKDPRIVQATSPNLRPKGLGLGAKPNIEVNSDEKHNKRKKDQKTK